MRDGKTADDGAADPDMGADGKNGERLSAPHFCEMPELKVVRAVRRSRSLAVLVFSVESA